MSNNPYSSPAAPSVTPQINSRLNQPMNIATQGARFVNALVDGIFIGIFSFGVGIVFGVVFVMTSEEVRNTGTISPDTEMMIDIIGNLLGVLVSLGYYVVMEAVFQRTVGKLLTGTVVVNESGGRPSFGQIVGRSFARWIPFEAFSFLSKNPVGWHDSLAKTRVIGACDRY